MRFLRTLLYITTIIAWLCSCNNLPATQSKNASEDSKFKFIRKDGNPLIFIGNNIDEINAYTKALGSDPIGVSGYIKINQPGIFTRNNHDITQIDLPAYTAGYPNSVLDLTLVLTNHDIELINSGDKETINNLHYLIKELKQSYQPVLLHIGQHVNLLPAEAFQKTWKIISGSILTLRANNIAKVWDITIDCYSGTDNHEKELSSWWPKQSETVDWIGVSYHNNFNNCYPLLKGGHSETIESYITSTSNKHPILQKLNFLKSKEKPILLVDVYPQSINIVKQNSLQIWNDWFSPLFSILDKHKNYIKAISYTNRFSINTVNNECLKEDIPQLNNCSSLNTRIYENTELFQLWKNKLEESFQFETLKTSPLNGLTVADRLLRYSEKQPKIQKAYSDKHKFHSIPGMIEAEHFDVGGQNISYYAHNEEKIINQSCRRNELINTLELENNNCIVKFFETNQSQWIEYSIYSKKSFKGSLEIGVNELKKTSKLFIYLDQVRVQEVQLKSSNNSSDSIVLSNIPFKKGRQVLKILIPGKREPLLNTPIAIDYISIVDPIISSPFYGRPIPLPGIIQAEEFNHGKENEAFFDYSSRKKRENSDKTCSRKTPVDLVWKSNKCFVTDFQADEWLEYDIFVTEKGLYEVLFDYGEYSLDNNVSLILNGEQILTTITSDSVSENQNQKTSRSLVKLPYGNHKIKVKAISPLHKKDDGNTTSKFSSVRPVRSQLEIDSMEFIKKMNPYPENFNRQQPYKNQPFNIPGLIEAGYFDHGDQHFAFFETNDTHLSTRNPCRSSPVETETYGNTCVLTNTKPSEWFEYSVNVDKSAYYDLNVSTYSSSSGGSFYLQLNGKGISKAIQIDGTDSVLIPHITTIKKIYLPEGQHTLRLMMLEANKDGVIGNIAHLEFYHSQKQVLSTAKVQP